MPTPLRDEHSIRERIALLRALYDRGRRRLATLSKSASAANNSTVSVEELSRVLNDINQAEPMLQELVDVWSACHATLRQRLSSEVEQLRQSAAACLALVSAAEQEYTQRRNNVTGQLDESANRNRAVRTYSHAMRQ